MGTFIDDMMRSPVHFSKYYLIKFRLALLRWQCVLPSKLTVHMGNIHTRQIQRTRKVQIAYSRFALSLLIQLYIKQLKGRTKPKYIKCFSSIEFIRHDRMLCSFSLLPVIIIFFFFDIRPCNVCVCVHT